jgi:aldose 1-epimerase
MSRGATGAAGGPSDDAKLVRIGDGSLQVEVLPSVGARLHRVRLDGHDLLHTPDDLRPHVDDPYFYGSYPMAPWCNRLPAGPGEAAGRRIDLPASFRDGTAIHGQVSQRPWDVVESGPDNAWFRIAGGGDGWPWRYTVEQRIRVVDATLRLTFRLTNDSADPMPGGLGIHPWFRKPVQVAIAGALVHPSNLATEPRPVPVAGALDRRILADLPEGIDATWTDLTEPPVVLVWPETGIRATMTADVDGRAVPFIVAACLPGTDAIAVEPETHAPDGLRRIALGEPGGLDLIEPGGSLVLDITLAFDRATADSRAKRAANEPRNVTAPDRDATDDRPMNKTTLVATIAAGRERLDAALEGLSDDAMLERVDERWTRKDVLAHLEAWERRVVDNLGILRAGGTPDGSIETDERNEAFYLASRDRPLEDVRAGERDAHRSVLAAIETASDDELFNPSHFAWTDGDPLADWFRGNTDEHYDEHLEQLTRPAR